MNVTLPLSDDELNRLIRDSVAPLRVTDVEIAGFDALHEQPIQLSAARAERLLTSLRPLTVEQRRENSPC